MVVGVGVCVGRRLRGEGLWRRVWVGGVEPGGVGVGCGSVKRYNLTS